MLHIAPERCFEAKFKDLLHDGYLSADLSSPRAMKKLDITDIPYPDETFDVIYCSHVLEHVPDDRKAMREFCRVLKDTGWAILLVPITSEKTFEDSSIVTPAERLRVFGQKDHVRRYGPDYVDRLRDAGFTVETTKVEDLVDTSGAEQMGLTPASGVVFRCTKGRAA
jgi:SAM-dependent methyltransferase